MRVYVGQLVFAKVKDHPEWPDFIINRKSGQIVLWLGIKKLLSVSAANKIVEQNHNSNVRFRVGYLSTSGEIW